MAVHQCPRCPLRFDLKPMLADHLASDHDATPEEVHGLQPPAARVGTALEQELAERAERSDAG